MPIRLLSLLFALLMISACATAPPPEPPPEPVPPPPAEPTVEYTIPDNSHLRINIASVGDMMIGTDYPENHLPDDDGVSFFDGVADILRDADLTFGNLEGTLVDGGEPAKKCKNLSACYLFRSPTRYAEHYKNAGFDVLSLANNHARDFGEEGRTSTMEALDSVGIYHSGREGSFASFEHGELKIAMLAYAVTRESNILFDYELAFETVAEHDRTHDIVIVSFHGGAEGADAMHVPFAEEEYYGERRGDVVKFSRGVVDAGADLVIGHGPHVVRGMELYNDRLIAYSLGNFATYYGISVAGVKGVAPILLTQLDGEGRFVDGQIISTEQIRPAGPTLDQKMRALLHLMNLTREDFPESGLSFFPDGVFRRARPLQIIEID
ncbi:MAG: CapA family protein [Pseudomonadota bacterium]